MSPKKDFAITVAPIAPKTIWPSIPIFHNPVEKVIISANEANDIGRKINKVLTIFSGLPKAPLKIFLKTSNGDAPNRIIIKEDNKNANIT